MASNPLSADPRIINPLVCNPQDGPGRFAGDTLHAVLHCWNCSAA